MIVRPDACGSVPLHRTTLCKIAEPSLVFALMFDVCGSEVSCANAGREYVTHIANRQIASIRRVDIMDRGLEWAVCGELTGGGQSVCCGVFNDMVDLLLVEVAGHLVWRGRDLRTSRSRRSSSVATGRIVSENLLKCASISSQFNRDLRMRNFIASPHGDLKVTGAT